MILARHSLETNCPPESVWRRWVDVGAWPEWDRSLERASIEGPFQPDTRGRLQLQDGRTLAFTIAAVENGRSFRFEALLPGARLRMDHQLEPSPHGARITREIRMQGWLAWFHSRRMRAFLQESVPPALRALARAAERPL